MVTRATRHRNAQALPVQGRGEGGQPRTRQRATVQAAMAVIVLLALATAAVAAYGQEARAGKPDGATEGATRQRFDVPAGELDRAVVAVGATAGWRVIFDPKPLQGLRSQALAGHYTPAQALAQLLRGSGWRAVSTGPGRVRLEPEAASGASADIADPADSGAAAFPAAADPIILPMVGVRARALGLEARDERYRSAVSSHALQRDDIERLRGSSVGDVFQGLPGVLVGENRNSGGLDINIRGMQGQGRVPVLVDGARQESTVYRGYSGVVSRSYVDPDLIGGIQIDKGPVLSAEGAGAVGGIVNMRTLNAEDVIRVGHTFGLRLRAQTSGNNSGAPVEPGTPAGLFAGNFSGADPVYRDDCYSASFCKPALPQQWGYAEGMDRPGTFEPKSWAGSIAAALRLESVDLVAAYARRQQGNYYAGTHGPSAWMDLSDRRKLPFYTEVRPVIEGASRFQAGERIPGTHFQSESALLKAKIYLPPEQELELSLLRYHSRYGEIMPSQIVRFAKIFPVSQPRDSQVSAETYAARYQWSPQAHPLLALRAKLWHTRTRSTNNSPDESNTADFTYNNERERYRRTGLELSNTAQLPLPATWGTSHLRYGLALQHEAVSSTALSANNLTGGRQGQRKEGNGFVAWQYKPWDSLTLDAGLRHSRFHVQDRQPMLIIDPASPYCVKHDGDKYCAPLPPQPNSSSGTAPIYSLIWEPLAGLQLYGRYAQAYRMPSLFESTSGASFGAKPDIVLRPEHAFNKELGLNLLKDGVLLPGDKLRFKLSVFSNYVRDYLTRTAPNFWETDGLYSYNFTLRNIDSVRFEGVEATGGYDFGLAYAELGATRYQRIEVCHTGSRRMNVCNDYGLANSYVNTMVPPRWHGSATLGARLLERKLTLGLRAILMGQRNRSPAYNDDTARGILPVVPWHAYRVFDLFAAYKASEQLSVDFKLDNATDRYYIDALALGLIPAPGRTARLSLSLQF